MTRQLNPDKAQALSLILGLSVSAVQFFHDQVWLGEPEEGLFGDWLADQIILAKLVQCAENGTTYEQLGKAWSELSTCMTAEHEDLLDIAEDPNTPFVSFIDFLRDRD